MNTLDALRISVIDSGVVDILNCTQRLERAIEVIAREQRFSPFGGPIEEITSAVLCLKAIVWRLEQIVNQLATKPDRT